KYINNLMFKNIEICYKKSAAIMNFYTRFHNKLIKKIIYYYYYYYYYHYSRNNKMIYFFIKFMGSAL
ncbi:MAG: hypothetical protein K7J15_02985, partial [Candidatus Regiella insecticola]|nr:hypothetical protein [Candidatus Regiella insecticola]